jgi:hypothetical protein
MTTEIVFEKGEDLFLFVHDHLITQGKKAVDEEGDCQYRAEDGTMCAIGCLIPEEVYDPLVEGQGTNSDAFKEMVRFHIGDMDRNRTDHLLECLQELHDEFDVNDWETRFEDIHKEFWSEE